MVNGLITPQDLILDYPTFRKLCVDAMQKSFEEWKQEDCREQMPLIQAWVNINHALIRAPHLETFKDELIDVCWKDVKVEFMVENERELVYIEVRI